MIMLDSKIREIKIELIKLGKLFGHVWIVW